MRMILRSKTKLVSAKFQLSQIAENGLKILIIISLL